MSDFIQLLVAGLATGGIYALVAIGFTLLWQTSQTINFAQGEFVMLPAFFMLSAMSVLGVPFWGAVVIGIVASAVVLGVLFKRLLVDPMLRHGVLPLAIATMALALFLKEAVKDFYSAEAQPFPPLGADINISIFGAAVALQSLIVVAIAIVAVLALQLFLTRTQTGRRMQATAQNPAVARILGIPVERMILFASCAKEGPYPIGLRGAGQFAAARALVAMGLGEVEGKRFMANARGAKELGDA